LVSKNQTYVRSTANFAQPISAEYQRVPVDRLEQKKVARDNWNQAARAFRRQNNYENLARETAVLETGSTNAFWGFVNSKLKNRPKIPALVKPDHSFALDTSEKCELLNKQQFGSVFITDDGRSLQLPDWPAHLPKLERVEFHPQNVFANLIELPNKLSAGPDGIPTAMLKNLAVHLAQPLSTLFNVSFFSGDLPSDWRRANVTPIPKGASPTSFPHLYRPISLTCQAVREMEDPVVEALICHFHRFGILSDAQHGFLRKRSTVTQLLLCMNDWTKAVDSRIPIDVLYLDIAKAFDVVSHVKLLELLESVGVGGYLLNWIRAWLADRSQRVVIDGISSDPVPVTSGVPQGSRLGPALFLLYINNLPSVLKSADIKMFADDGKLYFGVKTPGDVQLLRDDIAAVHEWAQKMQLTLALHKCSVLHIGNNNPRADYVIDNHQIESVDSVRDLGVIVTSDLKSGAHCGKIASNASAVVSMIFRAFETKKNSFLIKLWKTFGRPKLEYASVVWSPHFTKDKIILENVQRRFTRGLSGIPNLEYPVRLAVSNLDCLEIRRLEFDLIMVYKIIYGLVDMNFDDLFERSPNPHLGRSHSLKLTKFRTQTETRKHFFANRVVDIWNSLTEPTVTSRNIEIFKNRLKTEKVIRQFPLKGLDM